jgi:hypothetical protein
VGRIEKRVEELEKKTGAEKVERKIIFVSTDCPRSSREECVIYKHAGEQAGSVFFLPNDLCRRQGGCQIQTAGAAW